MSLYRSCSLHVDLASCAPPEPGPTCPALPPPCHTVQVRHDGAGRSGGWHLAWCKVTNLTTSAVAMFKCNRWVDRRSGADPGVVGVVTALPPDQAAAAAGRKRSAKDVALLGKVCTAAGGASGPVGLAAVAAAAAKAPLVQDSRFEAELPAVETAPHAGNQPTGPPGYRIAFHTSRICGSGTRAKVGAGRGLKVCPGARAEARRPMRVHVYARRHAAPCWMCYKLVIARWHLVRSHGPALSPPAGLL